MRAFCSLIVLSCTALSACSSLNEPPPKTGATRIIIQTQQQLSAQEIINNTKTFSQAAQCQLTYLRTLGTGAGLWAVDKECPLNIAQAIKNLEQHPSVRYAEQDRVVTLPKPINPAE